MTRIIFHIISAVLAVLIFPGTALCQEQVFTRQDTLRGSVTPEREWWDLIYYHLDVKAEPGDSSVSGSNEVVYRVLKPSGIMQIDLQPPMKLISAVQNGKDLQFTREGNVYRILAEENQEQGRIYSVTCFYSGKPKVSARPPWEGGMTWSGSENGLPFFATSCQGDGASLWWPCKDHGYDEPDSMLITLTVPDNLTGVSNGKLRDIVRHDDRTTGYNWFVSSPVNNYCVNINGGDYVHFTDVYSGEKGQLNCDFYVLRENLSKARIQFRQVPEMLEAFEYWFGPYPFYEDGYKLVEVPYLGMEHQSSVTYGNGYVNGYKGTDLSGTGWGLKFDFIIIHESGHEWFGNSITCEDIADMWIHESFTNYSENLYLEYKFGKEAGSEYVRGTRSRILNDKPVTGKYYVNNGGSHDMYYKGGNMLHTLRQVVDDDMKWRSILRDLNSEYYHKVVKGITVENFLSEKTGIDLKPFFDQYLRDTRIPVLEYSLSGKRLTFRWTSCVPGFAIPVKVRVGEETILLHPSETIQTISLQKRYKTLEVDRDWYVGSKVKEGLLD